MNHLSELLSTKTVKVGLASILSGTAIWIANPERATEAIQLIITGLLAITARDAIAKGQK
jgi:hypothetical protein